MFFYHLIKFRDGGQIHYLIRFYQKFIVLKELTDLFLVQLDLKFF